MSKGWEVSRQLLGKYVCIETVFEALIINYSLRSVMVYAFIWARFLEYEYRNLGPGG